MNYPFAPLSEESEAKLKQLERELGVILIAYGAEKEKNESTEELQSYVDDPNINLI
ncbi:hypothetical protein [Caldalkalibacillus mannanilyticus]|uniref:hypothetical protein n=1 Tax=Caldalkalibacillus mannanilyticus TaxID=1418 RepID=UPI000ABF979C|nr:hypothetical protein [Caldalkalibacillus mannanilyticus]